MTMRKLFPILLALSMLLTLAACDKSDEPATTQSTTTAPTEAPITAEYLYERIQAAAIESPITGAEISSQMKLTISLPSIGMTLDSTTESTGSITFSPESGERYSETTDVSSQFGEKITENTLSHTVEEDGVYVTYSYSDATGQWTRQEASQLMTHVRTGSLPPESLVLEEATQTVDDQPVHVLRAVFAGENLEDSIADASAIFDQLPEDMDDVSIDMTCITANVTYYLDTQTLLLVQIDVSLSGVGEAMSDLVAAYFEAGMAEAQESLGDQYDTIVQMYKDMTVTAPIYTNSYTAISYEPAGIPALPDEAREAVALLEYDPLQPDGSYILKELDGSATIPAPAGWTLEYSDYATLEFLASDEWNEISVYLLTDMDNDQFVEAINGIAKSYQEYTEYDIYDSHGLGNVVNGWQTAYITSDYLTHGYYAWKQINGDLWILVEYDDYHGATMAGTLLPLLDTITFSAE